MNNERYFNIGDLVRIDLARPSSHPNGFFGIVCKISKIPYSEYFLVHLQSGSKHWYCNDELIKASK